MVKLFDGIFKVLVEQSNSPPPTPKSQLFPGVLIQALAITHKDKHHNLIRSFAGYEIPGPCGTSHLFQSTAWEGTAGGAQRLAGREAAHNLSSRRDGKEGWSCSRPPAASHLLEPGGPGTRSSKKPRGHLLPPGPQLPTINWPDSLHTSLDPSDSGNGGDPDPPGGPTSRAATWRGRDPKDLLAQAGVLLRWVCSRLGVQGLVHLGQYDLAQVEET